LIYDFQLLIAGTTSDDTEVGKKVNQVYTAYAEAGWEFDGSGTLTVAGTGASATVTWVKLPSARGDSVYGPITTNVDGMFPITTTGDLFNHFLAPPLNQWNPS
jgi:hypothetical protein